MLITVSEFRQAVATDIELLILRLQSLTGRGGQEETQAWRTSLPELAAALVDPALGPLHLYFGGAGYVCLEYQLPAASSWCDAVLLGRRSDRPTAVVVELKNWSTRGDRPGPYEGLVARAGQLVLHPSDQVRGYVEYCRRFHSAVHDHAADVQGCVLFTRDHFIDRYLEAPNDRLARDYPCFTRAPGATAEALASYLTQRLTAPDMSFAQDFVDGRYRQERGFVRQIGAQILEPTKRPFELLDNQRRAYSTVRARIEQTVLSHGSPRRQVILIEGPPGSGKSVLAARIWATLVTDKRLPDGSVVLTTTSTAQTSNWSELFQTAGATRAARGVVKRAAGYVPVTTHTLGKLRKRLGRDFAQDPAGWRQSITLLRNHGIPFQDGAQDEKYLVSIVDEAHALINPEHADGRGQFGFAPTLGPLAWHIIRASTVSIFLLDAAQAFRDRENTTLDNIRHWASELGADVTDQISLEGAQFRCAGSTEYVAWVEAVLRGAPAHQAARLARVWRETLDFRISDTPAALESTLRQRVTEGRSARLVASYARPWKTKGAARPHALPPRQQDFHERYLDGGQTRHWNKIWNFIPQKGTNYTWFIQAPPGTPMHDDPLSEVGCPYVVRGFDFDYTGLLWMSDLVRRHDHWQVDLTHVHDSGVLTSVRAARREHSRAGPAHAKLRQALVQAYRILLTRGIFGCYLWFEDTETRRYVLSCLGESPERPCL